jgi:GNAT superfamily N-acetyltransferase
MSSRQTALWGFLGASALLIARHQRRQRTRIVPVTMAHMIDVAAMAKHTYGGNDYVDKKLPEYVSSARSFPCGVELGGPEGGRLVAMEVCSLVDGGATAWLEALRVHPSARRRGLALRLQRHLVDSCAGWARGCCADSGGGGGGGGTLLRRIRYTTAATNRASCRLAELCGLAEVARWGFGFVPRAAAADSDPAVAAAAAAACLTLGRCVELARVALAAELGGEDAARAAVAQVRSAGVEEVLSTASALAAAGAGNVCVHDWKAHDCTADGVGRLLDPAGGVSATTAAVGGCKSWSSNQDRDGLRVFSIFTDTTQDGAFAAFLAHFFVEMQRALQQQDSTRACMFFFPPAMHARIRAAGLASELPFAMNENEDKGARIADHTCLLFEKQLA